MIEMKEKEQIKVLLDHQIFSLQRYGGISRMFVELYKKMRLSKGVDMVLPIVFSNNEYLREEIEIKGDVKFLPSFLVKRLFLLINHTYTLYRMIFSKYQVFQSTYYFPYFLPFLRKRSFVLTVYDMIHEKFPEHFKGSDSTVKRKKRLMEKADVIVAISESTKRDIMELYNISEEKIKVVHLATSLKVRELEKGPLVPDRYILFVGRRSYYKNFKFFLESIKDILLNDESLFLVCAGGRAFSKEEEELIEVLEIGHKVRQISFETDEELAIIYNQALFFVFPSIYEGFGIPLLEAFACHCPVACSNRSSFPEVAGDAAIYFKPENAESIKSSVTRLLNSSELRERLTENGRRRFQEFSWEKVAARYKDVYQEVVKNKGD